MIKLKDSAGSRVDKMKDIISNSRELKSLNLQLNAELMKKFKARTASDGATMTETIETLIRDYLAKGSK